MKSITLTNLTLSNFKGIRDLSIDFGSRTNIFGDNATGKTTIFDAFTWLLFGKDSENRADFGIKTRLENGDTLHGVDHSVKGTLLIDGQTVVLERIYSETWTKQRGRTEAEFTGHSTDYLINSVPRKKTEYDEFIQNIIPEEQFKLLTNPQYFNKILDKNKRREIILGLENVNDELVIQSMIPRPTELEERLKAYSIDEIKKMASASMKKTNDEIKDLPVRIDELRLQIQEHDYKALEDRKKELRAEHDLLSGQLEDVQQIIQAASAKARSIATKKARMDELERQVQQEHRQAVELENQRIRETKQREEDRIYSVNRLKREIERTKALIVDTEKALDRLKDEYFEIRNRVAPTEELCRTCGQQVPEDMFQKTLEAFNRNKSKDLEMLNINGAKHRANLDDQKLDLEKMEAALARIEATPITRENQEIIMGQLPHEWHELKAQIEVEELELKQGFEAPSSDAMSLRKREINSELSIIDEQLGQKKRNKEIESRIEELGAKERELAKVYEEQEKLMNQAENFIRSKADLISHKVNQHFKHLTFKLFDVQINGGINPTCEALIDGVPYSDANNAAQINAGLDVINTLNRIYQTSAPVFIDNAESVNELIETDSQLVRLVVSTDKKLRIEEK